MCQIRNYINEFECLLFDKVIDKNTNFTEGMENPSFEMYLCKSKYSKFHYKLLNGYNYYVYFVTF